MYVGRRFILDAEKRDANNFARILNSQITSHTTPLEPVLDQDGQAIPNFPETSTEIHVMDSKLYNENLCMAITNPV